MAASTLLIAQANGTTVSIGAFNNSSTYYPYHINVDSSGNLTTLDNISGGAGRLTVSCYGETSAAGDTAMPAFAAIASSGYVRPNDGTNGFLSSSLANQQAYTAQNAMLVSTPGEEYFTASIVTGTSAPSASASAPGASKIFVVKSISISIAAGASAQTPLLFTLTQDAAGTPLILWKGVLAAPIDGAASISLAGLSIPQTVANKTLALTTASTIVSGTYIAVNFGANITT